MVRVAFMLPFPLLVLVLPIVHDPADGRLFLRGNFDKVQTEIPSLVQCFLCGNDAQLGAVCVNNTDRRDADLFIDPLLLAVGGDRFFSYLVFRNGTSVTLL